MMENNFSVQKSSKGGLTMALIEGRNQGKSAAKITRRITLPEKTFRQAEMYMQFIQDEDFSYLVEQSLELVFKRDRDFKKYINDAQNMTTEQPADGEGEGKDEGTV